MVFPDTVSFRFDSPVPSDALRTLSKYRSTFDADGAFVRESGYDGNLYVQSTDDCGRVSGSLPNWAVAVGLLSVDDEFGADEAAQTLDALEARYGLAPGTLHDARVGRLDYAADLVLPRPPAVYVAVCGERARSTPFRFGTASVVYKTSKHDLAAYDKLAELRVRGCPVPVRYEGRNVLRIEDRRRDTTKYFGRPVTGALLVDADFRQGLADRWATRALSIPITREPLDVCPETKSAHRDALAVRGLAIVGGPESELARIRGARRSGHLTPDQAKVQIRSVRDLATDPNLTIPSDLVAELSAAIHAAAAATL